MGTEGVVLDDYFRQYGLIAIFTALAVAVPAGMLIASWMLSLVRIRPRKPDPVKMSIYECGFETLTGTWHRFNFRFYSFALLFVVFDVEVVFLFPWAASFGFLSREFGAFVLVEMAAVHRDPRRRVAVRLAEGGARVGLTPRRISREVPG